MARKAVSLRRPFGDQARAVDPAPLFQAPLFRLDGILGRVLAQILCTRLIDAEPSLRGSDAVLGIDVSKNTFDASLGAGKARSKSFANSPDGWHQLIAWLGEHKIGQVHACLEATGRHGLGISLALHEAGHVVSIVNPAQIRNFARTKLGRNKTDQVDAVHIREYAELFKRALGPRLRQPCGVCANFRQSGLARWPA
jgi:hypothetical protein